MLAFSGILMHNCLPLLAIQWLNWVLQFTYEVCFEQRKTGNKF